MFRAAIPIVSVALFTIPARSDDPTETRSQALLGVLGDVLPDSKGFRVDGVIEDGPATRLVRPGDARAIGQILEGDTVTRIDGKKIKSWRQWYDRLNAGYNANGGRVRITVRGADGSETEWVVEPAVADVEVPVEAVPLIAVPELEDVPDPVFPPVRDLPKPKAK